jgi:error-prone DNA polymerase
MAAVYDHLARTPDGYAEVGVQQEKGRPEKGQPTGDSPAPVRSRVLVHSSGFQMSPYADVKPAGESVKDVGRKLWHTSPGSPG